MALSAPAKIYYTTASKLSNIGVIDGQIIFTSDTQTIYMDMNSKRHCYSTIQSFSTDADREAVQAPVEGYYFVESTHVLWRYKSGWVQITPSNLEPALFFNNITQMPSTGTANVLYCTDNAIYNWKDTEYNMIANRTEWETL